MATTVIFDHSPLHTVKVKDLGIGDSYLWNDKIYLKLRDGKILRVKGGSEFPSFELATMSAETVVEPLDAEFKFFTK